MKMTRKQITVQAYDFEDAALLMDGTDEIGTYVFMNNDKLYCSQLDKIVVDHKNRKIYPVKKVIFERNYVKKSNNFFEKKALEVDVFFKNDPEFSLLISGYENGKAFVHTAEGKVFLLPDHAIIIGSEGEKYPVLEAEVENLYNPVF